MFRNKHFCVIQYVNFQKAVRSALKVLAKSLKIVFDEVHFIVNMHSFILSPSLTSQTLPPGKSFATTMAQQLLKLHLPLDTSTTALVRVFSSILNHS